VTIHFYGIPNCDTVKKARQWLDANGHDYIFHDYKKEGANPARLMSWVDAKGIDVVLNKRGTTFRKLDEADKADLDAARSVTLMTQHPSMIKRPVVEHDGGLLVGFNPLEWEAALA